MNNYFDDSNSAANNNNANDASVGTLDKGEIDADISKLFSSNNQNAAETEVKAPIPENTSASDSAAPKDDLPTQTEKLFDNSTNTATNPVPAPETFSKPVSSISQTGSLSDTESKLSTKKADFEKQITDLQEKLKKIDDTLQKVSELKTQEEELLKAAQEL